MYRVELLSMTEWQTMTRGRTGTGPSAAGRESGSEDAGETEAGLRADPLVGELRALYDRVADEPLPDGLAQLLAKLDEAERKR